MTITLIYLGILGNFFWIKQVEKLQAPKDFFIEEGKDNADYFPSFNHVHIKAGLTKGTGVGFSEDLPRAFLYGGFVASTLGHELIHGFDNIGSEYDENGKTRNWWDPKSKEEFEKKADCMIRQYNNFSFNVDGEIFNVNGTATLVENISDNNGVQIGYR